MRKINKKRLPVLILAIIVILGNTFLHSNMGRTLVNQFKTKFQIHDLSQTSKNEEEVIPATGEMKVTFIDVGQGDATLVQTSTSSLLMDTGKPAAKEELINALSNAGVSTIDYLILTHPDADHVGNGDTIVETYDVKNVIYPDIEKDTKCWEITKTAIEERNINTIHPTVGESYQLGDASFTILCPARIKEDANNSSVGIKLTHGNNSFVMCGDAEEEEEWEMVTGSINLEADVLKCGHHGSSTATCDKFLEAVNPTYAVISSGAGNSYGHPHAEVIAKLQDDDVQIYRTDQLGTITAISDGTTIQWKSEK